MSHRDSESIEVDRWKKKFLDALEVHDTREKSLINRIKLLRRGLVGVSLAGDGLDAGLDRELTSLRATLRSQDSESGIEVLLERIERSVLRLDSRKEQSNHALHNALTLSIKQLFELPLPRDLKRGVKQYQKNLNAQFKDPQSHPELIVDFLELLRRLIRDFAQTTEPDTSQQDAGFLARLFSGGAKKTSAAPAPTGDEAATAKVINATIDNSEAKAATETPESPKETAPSPEPSINIAPSPFSEPSIEDASDAAITQAQIEAGEHPEAEPAFSVIANHAEPALLRILENIYVPEKSNALAAKVRARIEKGLNWYEFVAVLEDIYALISAALDEERTEFQRFLNELNQSLGQVQEYVHFSKEQDDASRASERTLDEAVRTQISEISDSVQVAENIGELKLAVQDQLGSILSSMDAFKDMKRQQQQSASEHSRELEARLAGLEQESKELRMHLARQEKLASRDALTELPNRANYDQRVREEVALWRTAYAEDQSASLCLAICDVDRFKDINDSYGHLAGDKVLKILAKQITEQLGEDNFVARYGGEEFTILMPDLSLKEAETLLTQVREKIENCPFHFKEKQVQITMSFGLSELAETDTPEKVFDRADKALYQAKQQGRNKVCVSLPPDQPSNT